MIPQAPCLPSKKTRRPRPPHIFEFVGQDLRHRHILFNGVMGSLLLRSYDILDRFYDKDWYTLILSELD